MPLVGFSFLNFVLLVKPDVMVAEKKHGKVFLVGAGPGDPKLLTLKAAEAIAASDTIVYDHLVNPLVLIHARRDAELIYAGKRAGQPSITQDRINSLLIHRARRFETVTRLKGGDPFIFGRGGEEAEALAGADVDWEVIPGVSSGIAGPAYAGIPLTHRDYASSVAFVTAVDGPGKNRSVDWSSTAYLADTLVVFMCGRTIARVAAELIRNGRSPTTPVAVIRWGTYEQQEVFTGALDELAAEDGVARIEFEPPAIAVVGEVVKLRNTLSWFEDKTSEFGRQHVMEATDPAVCVAE
jgi:uroporphyrin-III C-methyltransferase